MIATRWMTASTPAMAGPSDAGSSDIAAHKFRRTGVAHRRRIANEEPQFAIRKGFSNFAADEPSAAGDQDSRHLFPVPLVQMRSR